MLKILFKIIIVVLAINTSLANEELIRDECNIGFSADMLQCLDDRFLMSSNQLKKTERQLEKKIIHWKKLNTYQSKAIKRLKISSREFIKYRKLHCDLNDALVGGAIGNSHEMMRLACLIDLNLERIENLKNNIEFINHISLVNETLIRKECNTNSSDDIFQCLNNRFLLSSNQLKQYEDELNQAFHIWNEWDMFKSKAYKGLIKSSREFINYRKLHCDFNMALVGKAAKNSKEIMRLSCLSHLNLQRIEHLKGNIKFVNHYTNKLSK